jgi:hypothetical protein
MTLETPNGIQRRQTIEVNRKATIVQARGRQNRYPTVAEYAVLKEWAQAANLGIASFVGVELN